MKIHIERAAKYRIIGDGKNQYVVQRKSFILWHNLTLHNEWCSDGFWTQYFDSLKEAKSALKNNIRQQKKEAHNMVEASFHQGKVYYEE